MHALKLSIVLSLLTACSANGSKASEEVSIKPGVSRQSVSLPISGLLNGKGLESHFKGDAGAAAELFAREDWEGAKSGFQGALASLKPANGAKAARLTLLIAECEARLGNASAAAVGFESSLVSLPHLGDYLHYRAARSFFAARERDKALLHARSVDSQSIHGADTELLIGNLLRGRPNTQAVYDHYQNYLKTRVTGIRRAEARFHAAQAGAKLGKTIEAAENFKRLTVEVPLSRWAANSQLQLDKLLTRLPAKERKRFTRLDAQQYVTRGHVFYKHNRSDKSEADFRAALTAPGLDEALRCDAAFHLANSVFKQRDRTKAAPLFQNALPACEKAGNVDLYVKTAYQAGRSFATLNEHDKAITYYALIETKHPEHSYADDARLHQAEEFRELDQQDKVGEYLASISTLYPGGDMSAESLWRLAWRDYKNEKYKAAIKWLEKQIATTPINGNFWAEGQAQYWIARSYGKLGNEKQSISAYESVIRTYPLSYYALLALNRLRESHPGVFSKIVGEIHQAPADRSGEFDFQKRDEYEQPAFARAIDFLRLGLDKPASAELARMGFRAPPGREPLTDPDAIDRVWVMAALNYTLGNYGRALWATRWHVLDYKRHWPEGGWRKRWDIAYPPGYWDLIDKHAKAEGIPTELIIAIVREESGFDPIQESVANAIGLSQIIMPTAKRFAPDDIVVSRETLRDPDKNLRIGSRFLSFLMSKWDQQVSLIPPSYNAGEGAVARWMRERGDWDRDAWAEEIPYDETRRYSKRVISSYFTYRYLLHDEIPVFAN